VEPIARYAPFAASRSEAVLNVPDVSALPIPENIAYLFRHLRENSKESVVDGDHADGVILRNGQDDERAAGQQLTDFLKG